MPKLPGSTFTISDVELTSFLKRFEKYVEKSDECWTWTGARTKGGYGIIGVGSGKKRTYSHRASYEINIGPIPSQLNICHLCDNRKCVNPAHMFLGNNDDNAKDMVKKGRSSRGMRRPGAVLTDAQVIEIRQLYVPWKLGLRKLAEIYGVSQGCIQGVVDKANWKHLS